MHSHAQCASCGTNIEPCCAGDDPNDAAAAPPPHAADAGVAPRLFPRLFALLGGEQATVTTDALLFALSSQLGTDYDEARLVLEAAERVGLLRSPRPGTHRLQAVDPPKAAP